jgi:inositol oxygenase
MLKKTLFRNYSSNNLNNQNNTLVTQIYDTYRQQRSNIDYNFNTYLINKYTSHFIKKSNFWSVFVVLDGITDLSDPDTALPNSIHALQVAEGIRLSGKYNDCDWMPLVGLIHDMGKILYVDGCDEDGTSKTTQWGLVGDTFITGTHLPDTLILPELNAGNRDQQASVNMYTAGCGLRNCSVAFGHDEYMYHLLRKNKHTLPIEAEYIVRYHSLYAWHSSNGYNWLEDETDKKMKSVVQDFNKFDLYTKNDDIPIKWTAELKVIYSNLIKKYISETMEIYW